MNDCLLIFIWCSFIPNVKLVVMLNYWYSSAFSSRSLGQCRTTRRGTLGVVPFIFHRLGDSNRYPLFMDDKHLLAINIWKKTLILHLGHHLHRLAVHDMHVIRCNAGVPRNLSLHLVRSKCTASTEQHLLRSDGEGNPRFLSHRQQ